MLILLITRNIYLRCKLIQAYVLITSDLGHEEEVIEKLQEVPGIVESYRVYGVFDVILKIVVEDRKSLKDIIFYEIRSKEGVRSTSSIIVVDK